MAFSALVSGLRPTRGRLASAQKSLPRAIQYVKDTVILFVYIANYVGDIDKLGVLSYQDVVSSTAEPIYRSIGALLRLRRKTLGLTQEDVAARLGISRASLANMEIGRQKILVHQLYRLAEALALAPSDLLAPEPDTTTGLDWSALPLPNNLNLEQRRQIARLLDGPEPAAKKDDSHAGENKVRSPQLRRRPT